MGKQVVEQQVAGRRVVGDRGQSAPLSALIVVVALMAACGLAQFGLVVIDRAQARTAADAAALGGVTGGRQASDRLAAANHGVVESFVQRDGQTEVTVRVGRARATARARRANSSAPR